MNEDSANVVGKRRMLADIDHYTPFPVTYTDERGDWEGVEARR